MSISVFERYEYKYKLNSFQYEELIKALDGKLIEDKYSHATIQSLYYDTVDKLLIRKSLESPEYKEKLRLRSYGKANGKSPLFLEIKKKAFGVVYKRRMEIPAEIGQSCMDDIDLGKTQIAKEIQYFKSFYKSLIPSYLLIYDRDAYTTPDGIRLTFDKNPRYRVNDLDLRNETTGLNLFNDDSILLEIKIPQSMPLWLARTLSSLKIYKTSFSKYGEAYKKEQTKWKDSSLQYSQVLQ